MLRYLLHNHQNKGNAFRDALHARGWEPTTDQAEARFLLTDSDAHARRETIKTLFDQGKPTFIYPHAARPDLIPDFEGSEASPYTAAHFVAAKGHVEIMRAYGYPHPLPVVGWTYCPIQRYKPRKQIRRVLFAPIHPSPNGKLSEVDRGINQGAFQKLLPLSRSRTISLTVRYLYDLKDSGVDMVPGIQYTQGRPDLSYGMIEAADVVVSHQTFAHIAIARGVPTVMMGEWLRPRYTLASGETKTAKSFDKYRALLMYPLDILDTSLDVMELFSIATRSDYLIRDWRERMIGEPFDPGFFVDVIENSLIKQESFA